MKISAVEAIPLEIPYRRPLRFASGEVTVADHVLVRVVTDEGIVGHGEALPRPYTYGESQASIVAAVRQWFGPALLGVDPMARERIHAGLARTVGNHTAKGALDVALWDVIGQTLGQPCHMLLGGFATSMAVSHMVGLGTVEEMVEDAVSMRRDYGITAFKVKVGRRPVGVDVEACRALRAALGPDVELYLDANRGWSPDEALEAVRAMADLDLTFVEEPCPPDGALGRRRLADQLPIPLGGDESCARLGDVARELLDGACHRVSIKVARTGFTESQRILGLCEALGVAVMMGSQVEGMLGTLASVTFGAAFQSTATRPGELSAYTAMVEDILAEPLEIVDGRLAVREGPGLGAVLDEDRVDRFRTDR